MSAAALFLVVISADYEASERCRTELQCFLDAAGDARRIFIAAQSDVPLPMSLMGRLDGPRVVPFWGTDAADNSITIGSAGLGSVHQVAYYQRIMDLARAMAPTLEGLRTGPTDPAQAPAPDLTKPPVRGPEPLRAVYLADAPNDLIEPREDLRRFLEQQGYRILPAQPHYFPGEPRRLHAAIDADFTSCALFVQMLRATVAVRQEGFVTPVIQAQRALALGLPMFQWRSPALDLGQVMDSDRGAPPWPHRR